ncbi:MAG: galactokinase [Bacteroidota bacterium]
MPRLAELQEALRAGGGGRALAELYPRRPGALEKQEARYGALLERFAATFPGAGEASFFSAPGRTEIGGNHTDHNAGRVLAAAVDLDAVALASANDRPRITVVSEGYAPIVVDLDDLQPRTAERYQPAALIRGICAGFAAQKHGIGGFDAVVQSEVPRGSGLSSSACFEVLVATVLNHLYNEGRLDPVAVARIAQHAEVEYFGKPVGLMDQTTCAVGGFVTIDFADPAAPAVAGVDFDFAASGYALVITDTGGSHADLNEEYAAVAGEMRAVAAALGGRVLRDCSPADLLRALPDLRAKAGDRALLRALHYYGDNERVSRQVAALQAGDFPLFLRLVVESGRSSYMYLQNCYVPGRAREQPVALGLALSERILADRGAWRVHGGGFAGTIQAFVPQDLLPEYLLEMRRTFGADACHVLAIRAAGAVRVEI